MADVLKIPPNGASRADLRRLTEALSTDQLVALPGETGYMLCGSPVSTTAMETLSQVSPAGRLTVLLSDPERGEDYVSPALWNGSARRLTRRCWPGPA